MPEDTQKGHQYQCLSDRASVGLTAAGESRAFMRVYWWQGGLHLEPVDETERPTTVEIGRTVPAQRYGPPDVAKLEDTIHQMAGDITELKVTLRSLTEQVIGSYERGSTGTSDLVNVASSVLSSIVAPSPFQAPQKLRRIRYDAIAGRLTDESTDD